MQFSYSVIAALNAYNLQNYVQFEDIHCVIEKNPEKVVIFKDSFEKMLSPEAKNVVYLIFDNPEKIYSGNSHTDLSWTRIRTFLGKQRVARRKIENIRKEIQEWLREMS